jgi:hypothetical protein
VIVTGVVMISMIMARMVVIRMVMTRVIVARAIVGIMVIDRRRRQAAHHGPIVPVHGDGGMLNTEPGLQLPLNSDRHGPRLSVGFRTHMQGRQGAA